MTPAPASDRTSRLRLVGVRSPLRAFALVGAGCGRSPRLDALKSAQEHVLALRNVPQPGNLRRWSRRRPPNRPDGRPAAAQLSAAGKWPPVQAEYRNHGDEVSRQRELSDPLVATSGAAPSSADRSQSVPSGQVVSPIIVGCREAARRARAGAAWRSRCVTCLGSATLRASTRPRRRPDRFCAAILPRRAGGFITSRAGLARCWTVGGPALARCRQRRLLIS